ncbi:MAG TPA: hypothetical protein VIG33_04745, partial [Pseudobdellovibrionaceae bacterium]
LPLVQGAESEPEPTSAATTQTPQDKSPVVYQNKTFRSSEDSGLKLSFEEYFSRGTKSYQEKKFEDAVLNFEKALNLHPENVTVLTDLGLSYFQVQKKGLSIAMLRRALFIDPSQTVAEAALKFVFSQLEVKDIPHQIGTYERLRSSILNSVSINALHFLTSLLLFTSCFIWLRYLGRCRKAFELELAPPSTPLIGLMLTLGLTLSGFFTALKIYDLTIPRATVITDKVSVQSAPGEGQNGLFDLYAGFEVIVKNVANDWIQVTYPGGLTGWVKKDSVMSTSSKNAF